MSRPVRRTDAATAAVRRRGQETKATALREAGWLVIPPEVVAKIPNLVRAVQAAAKKSPSGGTR